MSDHKVDAAAIERPIRQRMLVWFAVVSGLLIAAGSITAANVRSLVTRTHVTAVHGRAFDGLTAALG